MFYLMHEGQIGLGSNAKLISFLSNIQSVCSLIENKENKTVQQCYLYKNRIPFMLFYQETDQDS